MIVAGFGARHGAQLGSFEDALARAQGARPPEALATLDTKVAALAPLAQALDLPLISVTSEEMRAQDTFTQSNAALAAQGTGSVAEATALAAAGPGARLLGPRVVSTDRMATCALAEGERP